MAARPKYGACISDEQIAQGQLRSRGITSPREMSPKEAERTLSYLSQLIDRDDPPTPSRDRQIVPTSVLEWATRYRRIDNQPFTLDRFRPLEQIYLETHPHVVIIKPAQRGVSEYAINLTFFMLDVGAQALGLPKNGLNVGYLFPKQDALREFSKERFTLRQETPYLEELLDDESFDAVQFKQVKNSFLYLRGAWAVNNLLSFSADLLVLDEFDRMDSSAVALARRRLNASMVRHELDLSTPTIPGTGIHEQFMESDQRVWEVCCLNCQQWSILDYFRDVQANDQPYHEWRTWDSLTLSEADWSIACPECQVPINHLGPGRWTAQAPQVKRIRGYRVPWYGFPQVDLPSMGLSATSPKPDEVEQFFQSDLGQEYQASGSQITEEMLSRLTLAMPAASLSSVGMHSVTMGVDVGSTVLHYRISALWPGDETPVVLEMGVKADWEEIAVLMEQWRVRQAIVDAMPSTHASAAFCQRFPGRARRSFFLERSAMSGALYRVPHDRGADIIQIDRTRACDDVYAAIAAGQEHWPERYAYDADIRQQMTAMVRLMREDRYGEPTPYWAKTGRPEHFFMATLFDRVARASLQPVDLPITLFGSTSGWQVP